MSWLAGIVTVFLLATPATAGSPALERALQSIDAYRYSEARMHLQFAAERGDREAQRNLGLMLLHGETLYGKEVPTDIEQARRWLQSASRHGCEVSAFVLKVMAAHGR